RRLNVNTKFRQFLEDHPLQTKSSIRRVVQSATPAPVPVKEEQKQEEDDARGVEETWKQIHAQSAIGLRRKRPKLLPSIQRSSTMDEIRRNNTLNKILLPPTVAIVASLLVTTTPELINVPQEKDKTALVPLKSAPIVSSMVDGIEPVLISSETLKKQTRADLVTMRSVRRPQKNPIDLNMTFESRKRIYQINKRMHGYQLCHRKCALQYNSRFDRSEKIDAADDDENFLIEMNENTRRRYEDRHQSDKAFV
ncbi:unnamed protein product, partial [Rotaria sp. Silwood2]